MPAKRVKTFGGRVVEIKSILLPSGNLLIPRRMEFNRDMVEWVEVLPGASDFKRWFMVAENESDPRESPEYKVWRKQIEDTQEYQAWVASK